MRNRSDLRHISKVIYNPPILNSGKIIKESVRVIGFDSEADRRGTPFMFCDSDGEIILPEDCPQIFFNRKYQNCNFVVWNLKYEQGALLKYLPIQNLKELQTSGETEYDNVRIRVIAHKYLSFSKHKHTAKFYDIASFYNSSLNVAAKTYLHDVKKDMDVTLFRKDYINKNWYKIAEYCTHDANLTKQLAERIIKQFENFGVYPRKLYSTAYISAQYFRQKCTYVHVKKFYDHFPELLDFAMQSYNGGKFEVTEKGIGEYHEYDIVSAYPYEISNLVNTLNSRVVHSRTYRSSAHYGFIDAIIEIPYGVSSPVAVPVKGLNTYPIGRFRKVITKAEYDYLISKGCSIEHVSGWYIHVDRVSYPYRNEIKKLMEFKDLYKSTGDKMAYHTIKIFLNSLYGKFVQLIDHRGKLRAGNMWNIIYGSYITAHCRIRISEYQNTHPGIIAVHTDSLISTKPLPLKLESRLGGIVHEVSGPGIILGSGVYQIGSKSKIRGFETSEKLLEILPDRGTHIPLHRLSPHSWRQVAHRNMDKKEINHFVDQPKKLHIAFDKKRLWLDDYENFSEVRKRIVRSEPLIELYA